MISDIALRQPKKGKISMILCDSQDEETFWYHMRKYFDMTCGNALISDEEVPKYEIRKYFGIWWGNIFVSDEKKIGIIIVYII